MKSAERFVNEECDVYDAGHLRAALEQRDADMVTDGIATGLSRALVALEAYIEALRDAGRRGSPRELEARRCRDIVRELLEATKP